LKVKHVILTLVALVVIIFGGAFYKAVDACVDQGVETSFQGKLNNRLFGELGFQFETKKENRPTQDLADLNEDSLTN